MKCDGMKKIIACLLFAFVILCACERNTDRPLTDEQAVITPSPGAYTQAEPTPVPAPVIRDNRQIIEDLIACREKGRDDAKEDELLAELASTDPDAAERWSLIMDRWKEINSGMTAGQEVLPDDIPKCARLCIVVLGYQLDPDGSMKDELIGRLEVALQSAKKYPEAYIACTGGGTASANRDATEAGMMAEWLMDKGIDKSRIIVEDKSLTTAQNAIFTCAILKEDYPWLDRLAIVTSDYHIASGMLVFEAEEILKSGDPSAPEISVITSAAYRTDKKDLSLSFQAGTLSELAQFDNYSEKADTEAAGGITLAWMDKMGIDTLAEELDLSGTDLSLVDMDIVLDNMPKLKKLTLIGCGLDNKRYAKLQDRHPDVKMVWEIVLSNWTLRTDDVAFSTSKSCDQEFFLKNDEAYYLKYCTDLVALDIGHNYVSDLSFLEYMPDLKVLILVDNVRGRVNGKLTHIRDLSELKYVPGLRYLEIFANNVSDFEFMDYLTELEDLNISYNSVSSIEHMKNLPKLERLWMEHTYIPGYEVQQLRALYPSARIVSEGEGSIDQGWRSGTHYTAMRRMFRENVIDDVYR
ncbi:MAG: YdcF family protein [Lachnospiraceae bacterium]|nr:YdcF family protein [Lachnospiraceae bacterium]